MHVSPPMRAWPRGQYHLSTGGIEGCGPLSLSDGVRMIGGQSYGWMKHTSALEMVKGQYMCLKLVTRPFVMAVPSQLSSNPPSASWFGGALWQTGRACWGFLSTLEEQVGVWPQRGTKTRSYTVHCTTFIGRRQKTEVLWLFSRMVPDATLPSLLSSGFGIITLKFFPIQHLLQTSTPSNPSGIPSSRSLGPNHALQPAWKGLNRLLKMHGMKFLLST